MTWEYHTQFVVDKLYLVKGALSKFKDYAPLSILRNVYYSIAYSRLQYGENTAPKYVQKIENQQNFIVKIFS